MNLEFIPKKYRDRVSSLEIESGLIDNCKYMLYFDNNWCWGEDYWAMPVKSKKEALEFIRNSRKRTLEEKELHI